MVASIGSQAIRLAVVIPATLLVVFVGLLWLLGLPCDTERREYVTEISDQAMRAASNLLHADRAITPTNRRGLSKIKHGR